MATIYATVSLEIVDAYGITGQLMLNVEIPDTATLAQLAADVATLVTDSNPLTQGVINKAVVALTLPGSGDVLADALGDVEKGGLFNFNNATDSYAYGVLVPDINPGVLTAQGLIDLANTDVAAWIAFLTSAHTAITAITKGVRPLTALRDALITFRKHRKPLSRKTKEIG